MSERPASTAAVLDDDVDRPLTDDEMERGFTAMLARNARQVTGLSQAAFASRFGFQVATLRDWEQGRKVPDTAAQSYLRVIAKIPEAVAAALATRMPK
ncbi:MAG: helix-turn-helix domain-containing protein [Rhodospirillaceae bacterium]|nr:helix-turn-helix domain-containing protein [Rhodospirillaceae bacterium]